MYDKIPIFLGICIACLGIFMAVCPKQSTKKEMQDDEAAVAKIKRNGFILIGCGAAVIILGLLR